MKLPLIIGGSYVLIELVRRGIVWLLLRSPPWFFKRVWPVFWLLAVKWES